MSTNPSDPASSPGPAPAGARSARVRRQFREGIRQAIVAAVADVFRAGAGLDLQSAWIRLLPDSDPGEVLLLCPLPAGRALPRGVISQARAWLLRHVAAPGSRPLSREPATERARGVLVPLEWETPGVPRMAVLMLTRTSARPSPEETTGSGNVGVLRSSGPTSPFPVAADDGVVLGAWTELDPTLAERAGDALRRGVEDLVQSLRNGRHAAQAQDGKPIPEGTPESGEPDEPKRANRRARRVVEQMLAHMHAQFPNRLTLDDVAHALRMNAAYLSSLFSRSTGMTFHRKLEEIRMARARTLLRDPKNRVREIAAAVGYASSDAFRHAFKAVTGVSPSDWRAGLDGGASPDMVDIP